VARTCSSENGARFAAAGAARSAIALRQPTRPAWPSVSGFDIPAAYPIPRAGEHYPRHHAA
jgi:hypothetical protein